jgi:tRNA 5-methylaminomethyl-2-thiouridine biosynthesis bifunctional protein
MSRIQNPSLEWDNDKPFSAEFNDVYYSRKNGLGETNLVFLQGNNLPQAWIGQPQFTIAETGFGTGLNFLATWKLFEETATGDERLDFISTEKFPMHTDDLAKSLAPWRDEVGDKYIDRLLEIYPPRFPGFHRRWISDRVTLTIIFDDVLRAFRQLSQPIDAWYLDGFAPKNNLEMWNAELFQEIANLSHSETTLASFTAAGFVKRGLKEAGFTIKREKGFGYKYHRITGKFKGENKKPLIQKPETITIIGSGLAGAACAFALKRRGVETIIVEKNAELGLGASGNRLGLINPRIEAQDNPRNDAGLSAFSFANHVLQGLTNIEYKQNGALHVFASPEKKAKLQKIAEQHDWLEPHLQLQESYLAYHDSASVNTSMLVKALLNGITIKFNQSITELSDNPTILACGWGLKAFPFLEKIPFQPIRGQVTYARIPDLQMDQMLMFGNYIAPVKDDLYCLGASFEQNNDQPVIKDEDDQKNIAAAKEMIGGKEIIFTDHWAQIRTASRDRFPIVGKLPNYDQLYISGALGSHGIQFSLLHAEILACLLTGAPLPVGKDALQSLSVTRFYQD